jgi:small subunit ribosomal protein S4
MVGDRKIDIPSYTVTVEEEDTVHFTPKSKIPEMLEKTKAKEPKVEAAPTEGEEAKAEAAPTEGEKAKAEAAKEDKPSTD